MIAEALNSYSLSLDYLRCLIEDVPDEALATQPGDFVNHPLWTMGHLVCAAQMLAADIGLTPWLPEDWQRRYGTGSIPVGERSAYSGKNELLHQLADAQRRLTDRLTALGDDAMRRQMPDVRYREMFPTVGDAVVHVLAAHTAAHVGQIIVWRRLMRLAPLSKVFD